MENDKKLTVDLIELPEMSLHDPVRPSAATDLTVDEERGAALRPGLRC